MNFHDLKKSLMSNSNKEGLFLSVNKERINKLKDSEEMRLELNQIRKSASQFINQKTEMFSFNKFKLFYENGSRSEYEKHYFKKREFLSSLAVMSLITEEDKYISQLEEIIWLICGEFTWALPAHLDWELLAEKQNSEFNSLNQFKSTNNFIKDSEKKIDLFAAETAFALAEISYLLESELDSLVLSRIKSEILNRVLLPFSDLKNSYHWESLKMNWSAVCAASIGSAAIYLLEETEELSRILERVINSLEVYLSSFAEDGVSQEGPSYWNYGFSFYTYFAELLKKRTDNQIDLLSDEKVRKIAYFQQKFFMSGDQVISFSDTPLRFNFRAGFSSKLRENYPQIKLPDLKYRADFHSDSCYRWPHIIRDLFWLRPESFAEQREGLDQLYQEESYSYEADAEWLIYKNEIKGEKLAVAAKAGNNNEPHNHNDLGSFIYHFEGESFLVDPGNGEYSRDYFGKGRYDYLVTSSRGHSTALVGGKEQFAGETAISTEDNFVEEKDKLKFAFRLENAYQSENLKYYQRKFLINRINGHLEIKDAFRFNQAEILTERFVSFFRAEEPADNLIKLQGKNNSILIKYDSDIFDFRLNSEEFTAHSGKVKKLYLLDFELKAKIKEGKFKFEIFPES